jgi:soluble lytic murein transglycosylase-like protein
LVRFCFRWMWVGLATATLWAADGTVTGDAARRPVHMTSVVRSDPKTGKLVRSVVVTAKPVAERKVSETVVAPRVVETSAPPAAAQPAVTPADLQDAVNRIADQHGLPPELLHSVIKVESNYNPYAVSPKGALGIMQLIPETAARFGVANVFDPIENIEGGARYLEYLVDLFHGNLVLAVAAYNAGENAVVKYGTVPPYAETQNYLRLVERHLKEASAAKIRERKEQQKQAKAETESDVPHVQEIVQPDGTVRYVSR